MKHESLKNYLSVRQAARRAGYTRAGLIKAINEKRLCALRIDGRWLIHASDLKKFGSAL